MVIWKGRAVQIYLKTKTNKQKHDIKPYHNVFILLLNDTEVFSSLDWKYVTEDGPL